MTTPDPRRSRPSSTTRTSRSPPPWGAWPIASSRLAPEPRRRRCGAPRGARAARVVGAAGWFAPIGAPATGAAAASCARRWLPPRRSPTRSSRSRRLGTVADSSRPETQRDAERWVAGRDAREGDGCLCHDRAQRRLGRGRDRDERAARRERYVLERRRRPSFQTRGSPTSTWSSPPPIPRPGHKGISAFVVPADTPGPASLAARRLLSAPHPLGEIAFEDCRVPAENRLGDEGRGFALGLKTLDRSPRDRGRRGVRDGGARARRGGSPREGCASQFGKPLAEFQLIQEKLARMAMELTAARLLVYRAAWAARSRAPSGSRSRRRWRSRTRPSGAQRIVDDAVQILGGRGCFVRTRSIGSTARCARFASTKARPKSSTSSSPGQLLAESDGVKGLGRRRRPGGAVLRDAPQASRRTARGQVFERNQRDETRSGSAWCSRTRRRMRSHRRIPQVTAAMARHAHRWDDIEIHYRGEVLTSTGHGFSGLSRRTLLGILARPLPRAGGHDLLRARASPTSSACARPISWSPPTA